MQSAKCKKQSAELKWKMQLRFTAGLNFVATGERVPFALLKERSEGDEERDMKAIQARAMREEGMSYSQIAEALGYKSKSTVMNILRENEE